MPKETKAQAAERQRQQWETDKAKKEVADWAYLEALPAQLWDISWTDPAAYGPWQRVPGHYGLRERFAKEKVTFWILGNYGAGYPMQVTGYRVQRHTFVDKEKQACSYFHVVYTLDTSGTDRGHGGQLVDYWHDATGPLSLCADTKYDLCHRAATILAPQLAQANKLIAQVQMLLTEANG